MFKAYKYRIYPTKDQIQIIENHFGCCRYIYNWGIEQRINYYNVNNKTLSYSKQCGQLTQLKKEKEWLCEVNSQSLQQALKNLDSAYSKFFKEHTGFPKFKSKRNLSQSFSVPQNYIINIIKNTISLPKIGIIKTKIHRPLQGITKSITVSKTSTGKYHASVLVDNRKDYPEKQSFCEENTIGIDLGVTHFAILSSGDKIDNPSFLKKSIERLKILHKRMERKQKGSKNRKKAIYKLAKLYEKIKNQRNDFQHKLSFRLIRENQAIAVESLNVNGMVKNHRLAQAISDASWHSFTIKLEYKALWYGKTILKVDRFEPSSKTCSNCGYQNTTLTLYDRQWICPVCNTLHDRDINAAINIKQISLANNINADNLFPADGGIKPVDSLALVKGVKQERVIW